MNEEIVLISTIIEGDQEKEKRLKIYANAKSVRSSDFYQAGKLGFRPRVIFVAHKFEYAGQDTLEYNNQYYNIFRTYELKNEKIELHCEVLAGNA